MPLPECQSDVPRPRALADPTSSMPLPESSSMPCLLDGDGMLNHCEDPFASEFGPGFSFLGSVSFDPSSSQQSESAGDSGTSVQQCWHTKA